jgi:hypothetical protein
MDSHASGAFVPMASSPALPPKGTNNLWYCRNASSSVVVFVHGILSESRGCWLSNSGEHTIYWPRLVTEDERLQHPSVFLGGFYTAVGAGKFDIADCAKELFGGLTTPDRQRNNPPIEKKRLVFICHSTGGIIVRYMLLNYSDRFREKEIGLVLLASPSFGSRLADRLGGLADFYDNQLGRHLRWGNDLLNDLDDRFKEFLDRKTIPHLVGVEACENHFVIHRKWLPDRLFVVERESAGRYFSARMLPNTDHFSIVKPSGFDHPAHKLLVEFWLRHYGSPLAPDLQALLDASRDDMRARNLPYFTPALLLALLHPNGFAASVVNSVRRGLAQDLRARFRQYLDVDLPKSGAGAFKDFDWFDREDVQRAQLLARDEQVSTITERLLFKAVLTSQSRAVRQMKAHLGKDFDDILSETERRCRFATKTAGL